MEHVEALLAADPELKAPALAAAVAEAFGLVVHPRSVERALIRTREARSQEENIRPTR
ncbi:hypothetical protein [Streptomyces sp. WAC00263]|nr:hypothetical protein [Streptomyces sp. WAC00263]